MSYKWRGAGNITQSKDTLALIHSVLPTTKSLTAGQVSFLVKLRHGVYIPPDTVIRALTAKTHPLVIVEYSGEYRFRKRVASKTLNEFFVRQELDGYFYPTPTIN